MVDFLPSTVDSVADEDRDPRVVGVDSEDADALVAALSSQTGRDILATLYEEPATPATIAERVDTSLQNAQYHLGKLEDGNLVEVADTAYSEKGREMKVYAPTAEPLVLFAGNESDTGGLQSALKNLLGGIGVLGLASLVVQRLADGKPLLGTLTLSSGGSDSTSGGNADNGADSAATTHANNAGGSAPDTTHASGTHASTTAHNAGGAADNATSTLSKTVDHTTTAVHHATTTASDQLTSTMQSSTTSTTRTVAESAASAGIPPGLLFFAGGALILVLGFAVWYRRTYRR
ncbi:MULTISPECIES: winged helix-turn-helix domain-containing protein [unclassified Haladaptatus]|uniref:ArsR/SmtB family transcription factor n=1 Tax=unclassified Haladaptatus TaxID=2622732 RepID=UPI00209BC61E|nr:MULTISPECIES: winged helix-turn-helix domain-containing protein [unclassified Haladaptatus]MCO8245984.1 winged helix-turn-helix domain-containing protein [Haladaptatus sp. AB643]MCO8254396.1 winged helix-turn-helix domain-containing protein [Haladaptatus sp. AB618]